MNKLDTTLLTPSFLRYVTRKSSERHTESIGYISVDSGMCFIGDPASFIPFEGKTPEIAEHPDFKTWESFCTSIKDVRGSLQTNLGVVFRNKTGDGVFPVTSTKDGYGNIVSVSINFE